MSLQAIKTIFKNKDSDDAMWMVSVTRLDSIHNGALTTRNPQL